MFSPSTVLGIFLFVAFANPIPLLSFQPDMISTSAVVRVDLDSVVKGPLEISFMENGGTIYEISEENLKNKDLSFVFESTANTLKIKNSNSVIAFNEENESWEEIKVGKMEEEEFTRTFALSPLLDASQAAGSIGQKYTVTMGVLLGYVLAISFRGMLGAGTGEHVGTSFQISQEFSCTVPEGYYGQLLMRPRFWTVSDSLSREVEYEKGVGIVPLQDKWAVLEPAKLLSLNVPTIVCKVSPDIFTDTYREIIELEQDEVY